MKEAKKMKCKCGGDLKRIAIDCYQCQTCFKKQKMAFLSVDINSDIKSLPINLSCNIQKGIVLQICKELSSHVLGDVRS